MLRKNIASAFAAILFALAPVTVFAGGLPEICGDIGPDVLSLLNRYAMMDPANFCIRSMTLAETRCWRQRDQVIRQANMISQRYNLAPVVPGCQPPVLMAAVPPPVYYQPAPVYTAGARTAVAHGSDFDSTWLLVGLGLLAIGGGVIALTICEGGGGGGGTSTTSTSIDDEFNAQYTLKIIGAKQAYKRGFTGQGIVVGLIDTGLRITSSEFFGRVSSDGGFDFTTNTSGMPTDESLLNPHGTEVAGVLAANRNFVGMHGVAYNALIQPLRVFDVNGSPVDDFAPAINYAISHGTRIINGSYGPSNVEGFETLGHQVIFDWDMSAATAYLNAVSSGAILVFPAGNEFAVAPTVGQNPTGPGFLPFIRPSNANITSAAGGAYRDIDGNVITSDFSALEPNTIVVVGTNRDLTMRVDSNRCGVAKDWCMAAPATNIFTTLDGVYTTVNGTSFAAPQVAGAAAILKQEFPSLTGAEIVDILLSTATDLGTAGVDVVFGHGLLNLVAATAPVGTTG
ncbi:MAG: S8 family serine peptidase, partial [Proteobacteria bacterium]|nr:S8 family serine peptidase [Pseudomonadota bacterium]